ncbi:MAG: MFS transporter [Syntrophobacteraceae bacterium]|nr:MFS transporter [Syntrophobacteraceae bacterium]
MATKQAAQSDSYKWVMLLAYVLMSLGIWTSWFAQAPLLHVYWEPVMHVSLATGGLLLSLPGLVAIAMAVTTGRWVDTVGVRKMMILSGILASIGFGLRPFFIDSFVANAALTVVAGYGVCILTACLPSTMIQWFGHEKGHTFIGIGAGSYFMAAGIGILGTANLFPVLGAKGALTVWSCVIVAVTVIWTLIAKDKTGLPHHERAPFVAEAKKIMQTPSAWLMLVYAIFISGMTVAVMHLLPGEMIVARHLPPPMAGTVVGIFAIGMGVGLAILPAFAGGVGVKKMSIILCVLTLLVWVAYMVLPTWTPSTLLLFAVVFGFFFEAPWATGLALMESMPGVTPANIGVAAGLWTMFVNVGVFFLPLICGGIVENTGGSGASGLLWTILIGYGLGLLAVLPVRDSRAEAAKAKAGAA